MIHRSLFRTVICCILALLAASCEAQSSSPTAPFSRPSQLSRRIEVVVRSQFDVPPDVDVSIGTATKSGFSGYHSLPITFAKDGKASTIDFLLSDDGNTLARLEKFDLSGSPADRISLRNRPVRGFPNAKVTVVIFDDLECPYCAQIHAMLFPDLVAQYEGRVRFVYKDYPLSNHLWSMHAAVDANCIASQSEGAYWNFVDYVHSHAQEIGGASNDTLVALKRLDILAHSEGQRSKLDLTKLDSCTSKQDESIVQSSIKEGDGLGVNSTPTLFVNGERLIGVMPIRLLRMAIDRSLQEAGVQLPPEPEKTTDKAEATRTP